MERRTTHRSTVLVHESLDIHGDSTDAFIENRKLRFVVEQSSQLEDKSPWSSTFEVHLRRCVAFPHRIEHPSNLELHRNHLRVGSDRWTELCRADRAVDHIWCLFDAFHHEHRHWQFDRVMFLWSCKVSEKCKRDGHCQVRPMLPSPLVKANNLFCSPKGKDSSSADVVNCPMFGEEIPFQCLWSLLYFCSHVFFVKQWGNSDWKIWSIPVPSIVFLRPFLHFLCLFVWDVNDEQRFDNWKIDVFSFFLSDCQCW